LATVSLKLTAVQNATLPKQPGTAPANEQQRTFPVNVDASSQLAGEVFASRLNAARGSLVGLILSAGLWAAIIGFLAIIRR
jgi:hypothetical protein